MNALEIKNFTKKYGDVTAVDDISISVKQGEFFGFLGKNGAGKTSTISAITGIGTITSGEITVFGIDVEKEYKEARKKIGLCPQEFNVDTFAKVKDILLHVGGYFGLSKKERQTRLEDVLNIFELEDHKEKQFRQLSGGLKRRLMLARAMMHDPELLILDEPTAGVDVELRHELWAYLKQINKAGKTIIFTSHYLDEVEELCERVAIMDKGKIIADAPKSDFTNDGSTLEAKYLELTKA
ncbi:MAG: ABC transporter ATP-binding protein [Candidatus Magasanikbacteria bacterium CG_4_9_14_0_2_um_filter_42_11]|uniref:ABC transporter ATP-binding protein n=1 Tax=Candidatus Magasanikbacteria bacterium CG_4_9_14_0_2_um_filter_42_11 TaxID=1974643 RepID=A0A2M8FAG3_9BACT|nr:MAG: ABC transporter ATP-binding protein [Candidatus Magasanikbacteria bacterium CG_4_10_14_0_8_um_filter_42_12]PJC52698.1 MAG: ABC transporter ATP-binding protein [Candidatus Magasanikbacteria bacterium CG_4_9_14_0_2_um_filter_42_11]